LIVIFFWLADHRWQQIVKWRKLRKKDQMKRPKPTIIGILFLYLWKIDLVHAVNIFFLHFNNSCLRRTSEIVQRIKKHVSLYGKTHMSYIFHIKNTVFDSLTWVNSFWYIKHKFLYKYFIRASYPSFTLNWYFDWGEHRAMTFSWVCHNFAIPIIFDFKLKN
jgi:hypothetical protein